MSLSQYETAMTEDVGRITPGTTFIDNQGQVAQLHGVGIQKFGDRYFAWGEDKTAGSKFTAIACYSSEDLARWQFEGNALEASSGDLGPDKIIERPKVLQRPDGAYIMYLHVDTDDYSLAKVGFATSSTPAGPYKYLGSTRPLGNESRDIGVFQEDGVGYLLSEDRINGLHIYQLSDDYLSVEAIISTTLKADGTHGYESPTLIKDTNTYYLFGSDLTGWSANDNKFSTSPSLGGPWADWRDFAPAGSATFDSQVSVVIPIDTALGIRYVYAGDRWHRDDLFNSKAVWLPLVISNNNASLLWNDNWCTADL